jgi:hypothetical protein
MVWDSGRVGQTAYDATLYAGFSMGAEGLGVRAPFIFHPKKNMCFSRILVIFILNRHDSPSVLAARCFSLSAVI